MLWGNTEIVLKMGINERSYISVSCYFLMQTFDCSNDKANMNGYK